MRWLLLCSIAPVALATAGCDDRAQSGRFVVNGSVTRVVSGGAGGLTIVQGDATPLGPQSTRKQALLYILTFAPGVQASGGGEEHTDGSTESRWKWRWQTPNGPIVMELAWDRESDRVTAGGSTFDRQRGNVFTLIRDSSGHVSVTQLGPIDAGLEMGPAFQRIQAALPQESPAKGATLQ